MNLPGSDDLNNIYGVIESECLIRALMKDEDSRKDLDLFLNLEKPLFLKKYLSHLERNLLKSESEGNKKWFMEGYRLSNEKNGLGETRKDIVDCINRYFLNDSFLDEHEIHKMLEYGDSVGCNFREGVKRNQLSSECVKIEIKNDMAEVNISLPKLMKLETGSFRKDGLTFLFEDEILDVQFKRKPNVKGGAMGVKIFIRLYQKALAEQSHFLQKEDGKESDEEKKLWYEKHNKLRNDLVYLAIKSKDAIEEYEKKIIHEYLRQFKKAEIEMDVKCESSLSENREEGVIYKNVQANIKITVKKELAPIMKKAVIWYAITPEVAFDKIEMLINEYLMRNDLKELENPNVIKCSGSLDSVKIRKF